LQTLLKKLIPWKLQTYFANTNRRHKPCSIVARQKATKHSLHWLITLILVVLPVMFALQSSLIIHFSTIISFSDVMIATIAPTSLFEGSYYFLVTLVSVLNQYVIAHTCHSHFNANHSNHTGDVMCIICIIW
jgi:ABC-type multidrug transport system permease subunit